MTLIIAAFLRFYNIAGLPPGLYPDEAMNGNNALEALAKQDFKLFYPENNGREGLFINIQALSAAIFGNEPWALRIVSAIFGIFTVLGVYFLAKELFARHSVALLSAFFLAAGFWHINFSRIGFRAIMAPFFLTWGVYFLLKSFNSISSAANRYALYAAAGGVFYGLGFHSYIAYRGTPLLIFIVLVLYWLKNKDWERRKKILFSLSVFSLLTLIAFAPLGFYFLQNPQDFFGR
ncbi:MAG: glycosyltransferase family 39 protein, partial [Patescibacteria group bacterium]